MLLPVLSVECEKNTKIFKADWSLADIWQTKLQNAIVGHTMFALPNTWSVLYWCFKAFLFQKYGSLSAITAYLQYEYNIWGATKKKSPRNLNAARKPLVVQLCAASYRELYPLWISLPSGVVLCGCGCVCVCIFFLCIFSGVMLVLFCERSDQLKWLMWRSNGFASYSASNLARRQRKYTKCLKKHFVIMP